MATIAAKPAIKPVSKPAAPFATTAPDVLRKAIIQRLRIDPKKLAAFGGTPEFDTNITNLYRSALDKLAGYDTASSRAGQDYATQLGQLQTSNKQAGMALANTLADRGLGYSGIALTQKAQLAQDYANRLQALQTARTRGQQDIGTARNRSIMDVISGRQGYESSYANNLQTFLNQQAQAAAQLEATNKAAAVKPVTIVQAAPAPKISVAAVSRRITPVVPSVTPRVPAAPKPRTSINTVFQPYKAAPKPVVNTVFGSGASPYTNKRVF